jgi:hypothetical protein
MPEYSRANAAGRDAVQALPALFGGIDRCFRFICGGLRGLFERVFIGRIGFFSSFRFLFVPIRFCYSLAGSLSTIFHFLFCHINGASGPFYDPFAIGDGGRANCGCPDSLLPALLRRSTTSS